MNILKDGNVHERLEDDNEYCKKLSSKWFKHYEFIDASIDNMKDDVKLWIKIRQLQSYGKKLLARYLIVMDQVGFNHFFEEVE